MKFISLFLLTTIMGCSSEDIQNPEPKNLPLEKEINKIKQHPIMKKVSDGQKN